MLELKDIEKKLETEIKIQIKKYDYKEKILSNKIDNLQKEFFKNLKDLEIFKNENIFLNKNLNEEKISKNNINKNLEEIKKNFQTKEQEYLLKIENLNAKYKIIDEKNKKNITVFETEIINLKKNISLLRDRFKKIKSLTF